MIVYRKLCKYFFNCHDQDQYLYPPIIAKTLAVSGFAASVLLAATPAHAISFNFQFQDISGGTNGFVKGTLSGLVEGNNPGPGITATVTSSPGGQGVASNYSFYNVYRGPAFTVTNGNITFADAQFVNPANISLFLGTTRDTYYSELADYNNGSFDYYDYSNATTQFTAATPVPFEYSPIALPASLAVCFGAAKLLKNHRAKKRMVSVEA
ncbi:hypothetical protein PN451_09835 [Dolichospermum planctonicum CS-1226]|uniref:PEP-CTERM sorting domain-containing protein n=1 Tax=Dolichospermum planctonicum CS-1226 TaxID=3021751 RepID=A0ABT5AFP6_9CYAN|nr:hypothetical protein [Dolichospermum planctonicum]MDB9536129.1 hypothetical protein [Dolichospermum planctonicum CS-1226]